MKMKFYMLNEFGVHDLIDFIAEQWDIIVEAYTCTLPSAFVTKDKNLPSKLHKLRDVGIIDNELKSTSPKFTAHLKELLGSMELTTLTDKDKLAICSALASRASDWQNKLTMRK